MQVTNWEAFTPELQDLDKNHGDGGFLAWVCSPLSKFCGVPLYQGGVRPEAAGGGADLILAGTQKNPQDMVTNSNDPNGKSSGKANVIANMKLEDWLK